MHVDSMLLVVSPRHWVSFHGGRDPGGDGRFRWAMRIAGTELERDYGGGTAVIGRRQGAVQPTTSQTPIGPAEPKILAPAEFLRIPPFPGCDPAQLAWSQARPAQEGEDLDGLRTLLRDQRVGGTYWAAQPRLPSSYLLVRSEAVARAAAHLANELPTLLWTAEESPHPSNGDRGSSLADIVIRGDCDPWHMLVSAAMLVTTADDELRLIAAICGTPVYLLDPKSGRLQADQAGSADLLREAGVLDRAYFNPFTGQPMSIHEAIELCGFWRRLIDSNREIAGGIGFAFWKQDNVAPLLWDGSTPFKFFRNTPATDGIAPIAIWRSKTAPSTLAALERSRVPLVEVEDGFLRSRGLGADCVPPLSIVVDRLGEYFDPGTPNELERLLQHGTFDESLLDRARRLRQLIIDGGLGKYGGGRGALDRIAGNQQHILVPGQVEDDRSVQTGGCGLVSNLELLIRVRERSPDAYIIYKPHPDVVAGHRKGAIPDQDCLRYADRIVTDASISSLIAMVDEVHVNTSLAGFEALLRDKPVTTHGVPFYSGWGLTRDLGPVPSRRTRRRSVDELVAASLLIYPRYLDPITHLPCPPEIVVARLSSGIDSGTGLVVALRRIQGQIMRYVRRVVS